MSVIVEAQKIVSHAVCESCGDPVQEAEQQVQERLRQDPALARDAGVRWVIVCAPCAAKGKCPCCSEARRTG
jgi:pyrimidine deaminase RibD-like protein